MLSGFAIRHSGQRRVSLLVLNLYIATNRVIIWGFYTAFENFVLTFRQRPSEPVWITKNKEAVRYWETSKDVLRKVVRAKKNCRYLYNKRREDVKTFIEIIRSLIPPHLS
jgi:hypothetical protein